MNNRLAQRRGPPRLIQALMLAAAVGTLSQGCSAVPRRLAPPQARLLDISLVQASFEGQRFDVTLLLDNPNAVAVPVRQLEFDVRLGGEGLLAGRSVAPFRLPAQGSETIELEVFSSIVSSVSRLMALGQGPRNVLEYEIHGELALDLSMREPLVFYSRGQVPLTIPQVGR